MLITDGLAAKIGSVEVGGRRPAVLAVKGSPKTLLGLDRLQLSQVREPLLRPFGLTFDAPNKVGLYLFGNDLFVVENFNDEAVDVRCQFSKPVKGQARLTIPADAGCRLTSAGESVRLEGLSPRTLVAFTCEGL